MSIFREGEPVRCIVVKNWLEFESFEKFLDYYFQQDSLWQHCFRSAFVERYGSYPDETTPVERINSAADDASRTWKLCMA